MKITVDIGGVSLSAQCPYDGAEHVFVAGVGVCPACGVGTGTAGLVVAGRGKRIEDRDTYAADAHARCCGRRVGTIRVRVSTIFGLEEDERVLSGQYGRVY